METYLLVILIVFSIIVFFIIILFKIGQNLGKEDEKGEKSKRIFLDLIIASLQIQGDTELIINDKGFSFSIKENSKLGIFSNITFHTEGDTVIIMKARWRESLPTNVMIRRHNSYYPKFEQEIDIPSLSYRYQIWSPDPEIWTNILEDRILSLKFNKLYRSISYVLINSEDVEMTIYDDTVFITLVELIALIGEAIINSREVTEVFEVEELRCYSCGDVFDKTEEICTNCGSPRPRCIICFQDLSPSEKDDVVILPCCGVYTHYNHIVAWLKQKPICPTCGQDLESWLDVIF